MNKFTSELTLLLVHYSAEILLSVLMTPDDAVIIVTVYCRTTPSPLPLYYCAGLLPMLSAVHDDAKLSTVYTAATNSCWPWSPCGMCTATMSP